MESNILFGAEVVLEGKKLIEPCQNNHCDFHDRESCKFIVQLLSLSKGMVLLCLSCFVLFLVLFDLLSEVGCR